MRFRVGIATRHCSGRATTATSPAWCPRTTNPSRQHSGTTRVPLHLLMEPFSFVPVRIPLPGSDLKQQPGGREYDPPGRRQTQLIHPELGGEHVIYTVAKCPYCGEVAAGLDADRTELVTAPDRADGRPCQHLAFVSVGLDVGPAGLDTRVSERCCQWLWVRGEGVRRLGLDPAGPLAECVDVIACELLPDSMQLVTPYRISGSTAIEREEVRRGSGLLRWTDTDGQRLEGILDGWGLFSETPDALVREVCDMAGEHDPNPVW